MKETLQAIAARIECGLNKKDTADCDYYEGIEHDALDELKQIVEALSR